MASPTKISLYSVNDTKNATDDAIAPYLTSLPKPYTFKQQHSATNVRLVVGYAAVMIAGALFYADWKLGWDATKVYTLPACVAYFALNGFLTYWIWAVEAGTVFVGVREGGQRLILKSSSKKYSPTYKLKVLYEPPAGPNRGKVKWEDKEVTGSFTEWFSKEGYLRQKELKAWLARNIEVVGLAETLSKRSAEKGYEEIVEDAVTAPSTSSYKSPSQTEKQTETPKAKKPRKKA